MRIFFFFFTATGITTYTSAASAGTRSHVQVSVNDTKLCKLFVCQTLM